MNQFFQNLKKKFGANEKAALATSTVLISLDLMGGSGLFSTAGLATGVVESGMGKTLCEGLKGGLSSYLPGIFQNMESNKKANSNHTNFTLFMEATKKCLNEVRDWMKIEYNIDFAQLNSQELVKKKQKQTLENKIIKPVLDIFEDSKIEQLFSTNQHLQPNQFIEWAFDNAVNFDDHDLAEFKKDKEKIKSKFCAKFRHKFLDQIRIIVSSDPILRDSYHTFLLHQIIIGSESLKNESKENLEVLNKSILILKNELKEDIEIINTLVSQLDSVIETNKQLYRKTDEYFLKHNLPVLEYHIPNNLEPSDRLRYSYRNTRYIGRDSVFYDLIEFMNRKDAFLWTMISGKAGQGKSRLAQEICDIYYSKGWYVGTCSLDKDNYEWGYFNPEDVEGVLIVIDYILGREDQVGTLLEDISKRVPDEQIEKGNVRVILLEREFSKDWIDRIPAMDHVVERLYNNKIQPIELSPLNDDNLIYLISDVAKKSFNKHEKAEVLSKFKAIDPDTRPLIAFIIGLYIKNKKGKTDLLDWSDITEPLKYILDRESRKIWSKTEFWKIGRNRLAKTSLLVTALIQKITSDDLYDLLIEHNRIFEHTDSLQIEELYYKSGYLENQFCLGLQPDLIAEFFIIKYFQDTKNTKILDEILKLNNANVISMLVKTSQNFNAHEGFKAIDDWLVNVVNNLEAADKTANNNVTFLSNLCYELLASHVIKNLTSEHRKKVEHYFSLLNKLYITFDEHITVAENLAKGAAGLSYIYVLDRNFETIDIELMFYKNIADLRKKEIFKLNSEIAYRQALAARNIIYAITDRKEALDKAESYFNKYILELINNPDIKFINKKDIYQQLVNAADNIIYYCLLINVNTKKAYKFYNEYILKINEIDILKDDVEFLRSIVTCSNFFTKFYTTKQTVDINKALDIYNTNMLPILERDVAKNDEKISEIHIFSIHHLSHYYYYFDQSVVKTLMQNLLKRLNFIEKKFPKLVKHNSSYSTALTQINSILKRYNIEKAPPTWVHVSKKNNIYTYNKFSEDDIVNDTTVWNFNDKQAKNYFEQYSPFYKLNFVQLNLNITQKLVLELFMDLPTNSYFRFDKIIGARKFTIPFYKDTSLIEVLCERNDANFYDKTKEANNPNKNYGCITFILDNQNQFVNLLGSSQPIHDLNTNIPIEINTSYEADEFINFFCSFVHGDGGAFTIVEKEEDIIWIDNDTIPIQSDFIKAALKEAQKFPFKLEENSKGKFWKARKLVCYEDALFLADFMLSEGTKANDLKIRIDMIQDYPIAWDLPILNHSYKHNLKCIKPIISDKADKTPSTLTKEQAAKEGFSYLYAALANISNN